MEDGKNRFEIKCTEYFFVRLLPLVILLIAAILISTNTEIDDSRIKFLIWIFWIFSLLRLLISSPDIVIHEDGLTVIAFRKSIFVGWSDFKGVDKNSITTQIYIYSPTHDFLTKLLLPYPFYIGRWRKNYFPAVEFLRNKLGDKFFESYL